MNPRRFIEYPREELFQVGVEHMEYLKDLVSKATPCINNACSFWWKPSIIKKLFSTYSEYSAHRQWVNMEIRYIEDIAGLRKEPYTRELHKDHVRIHTNGEIIDQAPELDTYRAYVKEMEAMVSNGSLFSQIPYSNSGTDLEKGSLVLLSASHGLSAEIANPRNEWARKNGFEHICIDLNKYMVDQTTEQIGVTAHWLHLAAIEEAMYRSNAEWIWFLDSKYDLAFIEGSDPFVVLENLETFHLEKFPLHSPHRDLKGGMISPAINSKETVFVAASNGVALDTRSLFIRNNDVGARYMQVWSVRNNLIDEMRSWSLDDQFDGKSQEAFAHMYRYYDFLRKRTAVIPQNTLGNSKRQ